MQEISPGHNSEEAARLESLEAKVDILNETVMACLVQLSRIYDILAVQYYAEYSKQGPEAEELLQGHEQGIIYTTAPVLVEFGEPEEEDNTDG